MTDEALAQIAGLKQQVDELQQRVAELQRQVAQLAIAEPTSADARFSVELNASYRAPATGYLSVSATSGRTGRVQLLVGENSPTEWAGAAYSGGESNYLGAMVREGEVFVLDAGGKWPAFRSVFTPLS
jgi:hypothetical protein